MHPLASAARELVAPSNTDAMPHSSRAATGLLSVLVLAMQLAGCSQFRLRSFRLLKAISTHDRRERSRTRRSRHPCASTPFVPPPKPAAPLRPTAWW